MREILYIQAGQLSNYVGTHFWNTQEVYLSDEDNDSIAHSRSFREGTSKEENLYTPRVLIFDKKANFGSAAKTHSSLPPVSEAPTDNDLGNELWNGEVLEYRQAPLNTEVLEKGSSDGVAPVRYWADFSRLYYHPRSFQMLPDVYDIEGTDGQWRSGEQCFQQFNEDASLIEDTVRFFLEESDSLQGVQILNDSPSFGPFMHTFLTLCRDEMIKVPSIVFPFLSDTLSWNPDVEDKRAIIRILNDARYLAGQIELASLTVPVQSPSLWATDAYPHVGPTDLYQASASLAAHIETSTLAIRAQHAPDDMSAFCAQLNLRGTSTPFAELCGVLPGHLGVDSLKNIFNYSHSEKLEKLERLSVYSRRDVTRGFGPSLLNAYSLWSDRSSTHDLNTSRKHASSYPVPKPLTGIFGIDATESSAQAFSSLSSASSSARIFRKYAEFVDTTVRRRRDILLSDEDKDDMKELANELWTVHDSLSEDDGDGNSSGGDDAGAADEE